MFLHGDSCNADYMQTAAETVASKTNAITMLMARPGCSVDGRTSAGWHGQKDFYTEENISKVENAVSALKKHYKPNKTYLVDHSGGAATAGAIIGHKPNLVDGVVLIAFPADIEGWRQHRRGHNSWTNSLSPQDFIKSIKADTQVYIVSGGNDSNTTPELAKKYTHIAKQSGVNIKHLVVKKENHGSIVTNKKTLSVINSMVKN